MDENLSGVHQLAERIAKLERQNRFWKIGGLLAIILLAFSVVAGLRAQEAPAYSGRTIEAERFLLKGADGRVLGEWSATRGGGALALYSPDGKVIWSSVPRIQQ
ncbi:MAG TPA: hypothetical protein VMF66_01855 [Candidatus Acidoferrum sp.]|nr:hypothetical protein [Candidatus Acidoferrum sp.]